MERECFRGDLKGFEPNLNSSVRLVSTRNTKVAPLISLDRCIKCPLVSNYLCLIKSNLDTQFSINPQFAITPDG